MSIRISITLDLPNVTVAKKKTDKYGNVRITVKSTEKGCLCHVCGKHITKPYGHGREIKLRHFPILGKETYILISPPRFKCFDCPGKPITTQAPSWYTQRSPNTAAYENYIIMQLVNSTVSDVAHRENLGEDAIQGIIDRHISKKIDWNKVKSIPIAGLDEISLKKGHKDFVTIVTANIDGEITLLGVLEGNKKNTVKKFLLSIPSRLRKTVRVVCSDLHEGFINAAKEVFKSAKVTADRFHVAKLYRNGLEKLRKQEMKRLREELSEEEYKGLKGIMWILRKNPSKLEKDELIKLEQLFKYSPELKTAYELSNGLTDIFNEKISKRRAKNKIETWMKNVAESGLNCFNTFLSTLEKRKDEILNYFAGRNTSGFVEGINNKIKVLKRRCYGIFNLGHLFQRIQLDLAGF